MTTEPNFRRSGVPQSFALRLRGAVADHALETMFRQKGFEPCRPAAQRAAAAFLHGVRARVDTREMHSSGLSNLAFRLLKFA